jgi:DNA-binding NtrC family response regulator
MLVDAILDDIGDRESDLARQLASGALTAELARHSWPGNVRELRNYLEACLARQETRPLLADGEAPAIDIRQPLRTVRERWLRHVERRYLEELLAAHGNNVSAAARAAGVDRVHLHRLLVKTGLR